MFETIVPYLFIFSMLLRILLIILVFYNFIRNVIHHYLIKESAKSVGKAIRKKQNSVCIAAKNSQGIYGKKYE